MTDKIANHSRIAQSNDVMRANLDKINGGRSSQSRSASEQASSVDKSASSADSVTLSNLEQKVQQQPAFDRQKVESIKQAIRDGNYPLDARRIAENFVALERMIHS